MGGGSEIIKRSDEIINVIGSGHLSLNRTRDPLCEPTRVGPSAAPFILTDAHDSTGILEYSLLLEVFIGVVVSLLEFGKYLEGLFVEGNGSGGGRGKWYFPFICKCG